MRKLRPAELVRMEADLALGDFWFFATEGCGLDLVRHVHGDIADALTAGDWDELLTLLPRGHFKTHLFSCYLAWRIAQDRNFTGLVVAVNFSKGAEVVYLTRQMLQRERVVQWFGSFASDEAWSTERFIVSGRTKVIREATLSCMGMDAFRPGGHFDVVLFEDVEDQDTVESEEITKKTRRNDALAYPMADKPGAKRITDGTFYGDSDLYNYKLDVLGFLREENEEAAWTAPINGSRNFRVGGKAVVFYKPAQDEDGNPLFPERFSREKLEETRLKMGEEDYSRQYLLNPGVHKDKPFPPELFVYEDEQPGDLLYFYGIDAARTKRRDGDRTGVAVVGVDRDGVWHVSETKEERFSDEELIAELFRIHHSYYKPLGMIEEDGYVAGLKPSIDRAQRARGTWLNLKYVNAHSRENKDGRVLALGALFRSKSIRFLRGPATATGIQRLQRYGASKRRDAPDALANVLEIAHPPRKDHRNSFTFLDNMPPWIARHLDPRIENERKNQPYKNLRGDRIPWRAA